MQIVTPEAGDVQEPDDAPEEAPETPPDEPKPAPVQDPPAEDQPPYVVITSGQLRESSHE